VGIDATALDFGLLGDGELLRNPYFYRDPSLWTTEEEVAKLCSERRAFHLTGYNLTRGPMHYQAKAAPELFERADTLVPLPQLLSYELGADPMTELSYAMTLQMFDVQSLSWADELIEAIGFPREVLEDPVPAGTVAGTVDTDGTDLEEGPDVVLPPSHDTAAAVGSLPLSEANNAFLCTGSWFIPGLELPEPLVTDEVFEIGGSNEVGVEGTVRFLRNLPGFSLLELCREQWEAEGKTYEYEPLLAGAADVGTETPLIDVRDGLFVDAQFEGDVEERIHTYRDRTGQTPPIDEFEVTNCILVSLAAGTAVVLDQLIDVADETVDRIHLGGGGVRNDLFCQMFASAIDRPVHAGPTEATALGNLLVQMRSADEIGDIAAGRAIVREEFDVDVYEPRNRDAWAEVRERLRGLDG
jgi:rhamnulokinase